MTRKRRRTAKKVPESEPEGLLDRIVSIVEKDRFNVLTGFLYLAAIMALRAWLEGEVLGYASMNLYYFAWQMSFFAAVFMGGVAVFTMFSGAGLKRSCNVVLFGFWLILLPPVIDSFFFGTGTVAHAGAYNYLTGDSISGFLLPFSGGGPASWGLMFQAVFVLSAGALYLWARTRSLFKGIVGSFSLIVFMIFMAARPLFITTEDIAVYGNIERYIVLLGHFRFPIVNYYAWMPDTAYVEALIYQQRVLLYTAYDLILFVLFFLLALLASSKKLFLGFLKSLRLLRHGHFMLMGLVGVLMVRTVDSDFARGLALSPAYILHLPYVLLIMLSIFFVWQFTTMVNDIYDRKIDEVAHPDRPLLTGDFSEGEYRQMALMFGILALCTSAVLGLLPFLLILAFLLLGTAYSVPPMRFRDSPASSLIIGLGSMLAYLVGVYSPGHWEVVVWDLVNNQVVNELRVSIPRVLPLSGDIITVGLMILTGLTLAPILTQMKDYEGDKKGGARTIFTMLGFERGRAVVQAVVPLLFLLPLLVINDKPDLILLPGLALASFIVLVRTKTVMPVFVLYFIAALYSLLRILP